MSFTGPLSLRVRVLNRQTSLALAEMKILLREVYSHCDTTISEQMDGDMEISDQIISSRPRGQTCKLVFERIVQSDG